MTKTKKVLNVLNGCIDSLCQNPQNYLVNPKDFTRQRKLPLRTVIRSLLAMQSKSLSHELLEIFDFNESAPTASAFVQQRSKIMPEAFEHIFKSFTASVNIHPETYRGYRLFAVDGSDITIPANPNDPDSFFENNTSKSYSMLHLNAMYDLMNHTYTDAVIQKRRKENEHKAFVNMVDKADGNVTKAVFMADRGYGSYNDMAHVQEKNLNFLFRIKDRNHRCILAGFDFPDDEYDVELTLHLTRKQTNSVKELFNSDVSYKFIPTNVVFDYLPDNKESPEVRFYDLKIRFVRFRLTDDSYEVVATNLNKYDFPPSELKKLYAMRWGIETSFRDLKYTVGLVSFHSKKTEFIYQEIFARLIMYNFSELITSHVVIRQKHRKHCCKVDFSHAVQICRSFFLDKISPHVVDTLIARFLTPIRTGRQSMRCPVTKGAVSFSYRIA